ncbi:PREDICTED: uncharacterized protein LOC103336750 isoform X2 [Prunus mume]|uniref:Uncharacterized protein LOC103336750 isoform X2 n=1 Tax=Prunus mume TaxID=102107 RepID=A0ABM1LQD5_PRUMU|nr:PREDICTED: uncharacterized protein LOC103336750 isoform X2 [Prunus mume]
MDPRYTGEILKHLEKQSELLKEAKISMSEELHQLKVEEEMLMRKFYEIMSAHGKVKKIPVKLQMVKLETPLQ